MSWVRVILFFLILFLQILVVCPSAQETKPLETGVVKILASGKVGTGFIVKLNRDSVYIVTVSHVVEGVKHPKVEFFTRRNMPVTARVVGLEGEDPRGLALLLVTSEENAPAGIVALCLAPSMSMEPGEDVIVIGFPRLGGPWSLIKGSVASRKGQDFFLNAAIDEGVSGSPVIKEEQVVGLVTGKSGSYGVAIPAAIVQLFLEGYGVTTSPCGIDISKVVFHADFEQNKVGQFPFDPSPGPGKCRLRDSGKATVESSLGSNHTNVLVLRDRSTGKKRDVRVYCELDRSVDDKVSIEWDAVVTEATGDEYGFVYNVSGIGGRVHGGKAAAWDISLKTKGFYDDRRYQPFKLNKVYHFRVDMDIKRQKYSASIDGQTIASVNDFNSDKSNLLEKITFSTFWDSICVVGIDNIIVQLVEQP
jgi:hypothetical protein